MSRRIRRGRAPIDLPLKTPPAATDRLIGHDANGAMFQATLAELTDAILGNISAAQLDELNRLSPRAQVAGGSGAITQLPGRVQLTSTRNSPGDYTITAPVGYTIFSAVATLQLTSHTARAIRIGGLPASSVQVETYTAAGSVVDGAFTFWAELTQ